VQLGLGAHTERPGAEPERFELVEPSTSDRGVLVSDVRKNIFQDLGVVVRHS